MKTLSNFQNFIDSLESMQIEHNGNQLSIVDQYNIDNIYGTVNKFISSNNLLDANQFHSLESIETPIKSLNNSVGISDLTAESLLDLCVSCKVPTNQIKSAMESIALCIHNYTNGYNASAHFQKAAPSSVANSDFRGYEGIFSDRMVGNINTETAASLESFGADISNTITDARVAIAVTILRYHRGALHRLILNIPTDSVMVMYKVENMEVYDLSKSRSDSAAVRYEGNHRIPLVDLYGDPSPANSKLKPIILRTANDASSPNNKLLAENIVKINTRINMFELSIDAGQVGYNHLDFTDLVADNVRIKSLYVDVTDGSNTERFNLNVSEYSGARMLMSANSNDSGDRSCVMHDIMAISNDSKTASGAASALLAAFTDDAAIKFNIDASGNVNLKTSDIVVLGNLTTSIGTISGNAVVAADQTLFRTLTFKLVGYEPAAEFSEENIRKTTKAMRIMTKPIAYEIPGSQNYVVQYSLTQSRPEKVIDGLAKLMAIGNDDRGIKLILDTLGNVYDRIAAEKKLSSENYVNRIGQAFVSGQRVKPSIFMDTMAIDPALKNIRSADKWGDIRAFAEEYLLNVFSRLYRESYYTMELGDGEKPIFSVLTSIPIKNSLLSVPHYHSHLVDTAADKVADGVVEFRRTLPDGTVMNVITTTFNYMDDKMLIVPVRPSNPNSTLNFGHNRERGQFLAQATPTVNDAIFNSIIGNSREFPIVLTPIGALVQVSGLHVIFDEFGSLGI
mgnify:FL=1